MLTAVDAGEVDVTVSEADSDLSGICHIKVVVTTTGVITPASLELKTNGQLNAALGAKAAPENATGVASTCESSNPAVAKVDAYDKQKGSTLKKAAFSLLSGARKRLRRYNTVKMVSRNPAKDSIFQVGKGDAIW